VLAVARLGLLITRAGSEPAKVRVKLGDSSLSLAHDIDHPLKKSLVVDAGRGAGGLTILRRPSNRP
jgi:hypothetical protein